MKIEDIKERIIEEYKQGGDIFNKSTGEKTEKNFTKVGVKIIKPTNILFGLGRSIWLAERDWIIDKILRNQEVPRLEDSSVLGAIIEQANYPSTIFIPSDLHVRLITENHSLVNFTRPFHTIKNSKIIPVPSNKLDKMIIVDSVMGLIWRTKNKESSPIYIEETDNLTNWEIYTLNEVLISPQDIKIIEIINER